MKSLKEYLSEAVEFNTNQYVASHGNPRGRGSWLFSVTGDVNPDKDKEGIDYIRTPSMTYQDAKKVAAKWAKKMGYEEVFVMP